METYYFTFGQCHICPLSEISLKDYYIKIVAKDYDEARKLMVNKYSDKWAFQYSEDEFDSSYTRFGQWDCLVSQDLIKDKLFNLHNEKFKSNRNPIWDKLFVSRDSIDFAMRRVSGEGTCSCGKLNKEHTFSNSVYFFYGMSLLELCDRSFGKL